MNSPKEISLSTSLLPIVLLISMLTYNILVFEDKEWLGEYTYQLILLITSSIVSLIGFVNKVSLKTIITKIYLSIKSIATPIIILLLVGALAGTWKVSGVIPAMVYYGLQLIDPSIFLPACIIICAIISLATGSSWSTSATVGIALIGIGKILGIPIGMVAGAVISGAYFGDKLSPLSDTTNLAPAMAGGELFSHIRYMSLEAHMAFEQADSRAMDANMLNDEYNTGYIANRGPRRSGRN